MSWFPAATENKRRALPAYAPNLLCRFLKESSMAKQHFYPDLDFMDLGVRNEPLQVQGNPIMLQLSVAPSYELTLAARKRRAKRFLTLTIRFKICAF